MKNKIFFITVTMLVDYMTYIEKIFYEFVSRMPDNKKCIINPEERVPILQPNEKLLKRLDILADHFQSTYNIKPLFFVRVPGR